MFLLLKVKEASFILKKFIYEWVIRKFYLDNIKYKVILEIEKKIYYLIEKKVGEKF